MGAILSSRIKDDGKVVFEVSLDYEEATQLKGFMNNIHIFSENVADIKANISQRGKNEATKYFLIPKELRKNMKFNAKTTCQKIETKTKTIFIYVIDKIGL
ncbi:hypothetical protein A2641_01005 [Candidatus Nomurabacteria bacterium RIFCSPHIGHO2_01_FULL_37_25]|nr:hypothetical protein [Candidatus Woesearchaeota archaeon]OGI60885.1 MAG: hypothetical protein A2641_01005 [Candidatus Nomurabacteria bacterium RIFCSPHIGHO2_01_FULL_37_25]